MSKQVQLLSAIRIFTNFPVLRIANDRGRQRAEPRFIAAGITGATRVQPIKQGPLHHHALQVT